MKKSNKKPFAILLCFFAAILIAFCIRSALKPAVPYISPEHAASDGYESGYWDGSHYNSWQFSYMDSLYKLAGVIEQYDSAYQVGFEQGRKDIIAENERKSAYLKELYDKGYQAGYHDGRISRRNDEIPYSDNDARRSYGEGYSAGYYKGEMEYAREWAEYMREQREKTANEKKVPGNGAGLPQGYQDGYDDGYEDGCENDYKDSWNPRSKDPQYLIDYNEGYNEGFESGRLDYVEDYALEGEFEEDWW